MAQLKVYSPNNAISLNTNITKAILSNSAKFLKQTKGKICNKKSTPWWNTECSRSVALRRREKIKCEKYPTIGNLQALKQLTYAAKNIVDKSKQDSWRKYVGEL